MLVIVRADLATMTQPLNMERLRDGLLLPLSRPSSRHHPDRHGLSSPAVRRELPRGRGRGGGVGRRGHVALRAASVAGARRQTPRARAAYFFLSAIALGGGLGVSGSLFFNYFFRLLGPRGAGAGSRHKLRVG